MEKTVTATGGAAPDKNGKQEDAGCGCGTVATGMDAIKWETVGGILPDNEGYLKTIFNFVQTGLIVINADTHTILDANPRAIEMLGIDRSTIIGNICHKYLCPQQKGKCPITDLGMKVDRSERTMLMPSGKLVPIIKTVIPIQINGRHYLLESFLDITALKETEDELNRKTEELARSNLELQQFAYIASHDLQEPLRAISGFTELLQKRYQGRLDEKADKYIGFITEGSLRMQQMIQDLLAYSRVETQAREFAKTDSQASLDTALANLRVSIQENHAVITHDPLPEIIAEGEQITSLFQNLVSNAIKYHKPDVTPTIHIGVQKEGNNWQFSVADNGIGIEEKYGERIFKIFQRLHTRDEYPGTGIGLAVCKRIVDRHGGKIWIKSTLGVGTTFYFTIPVTRKEKKP
jgi:PAS domain S-box-containing protein